MQKCRERSENVKRNIFKPYPTEIGMISQTLEHRHGAEYA
jgi:hypothetical protein